MEKGFNIVRYVAIRICSVLNHPVLKIRYTVGSKKGTDRPTDDSFSPVGRSEFHRWGACPTKKVPSQFRQKYAKDFFFRERLIEDLCIKKDKTTFAILSLITSSYLSY